MPTGPRRLPPLSKKVAKKPVLNPISVGTGQTGITSDKRPASASSNLQRSIWGIRDRPDKGDWT
jgi:hypothetical protein